MKLYLGVILIASVCEVYSYSLEGKHRQDSLRTNSELRIKRQNSDDEKKIVCFYASWSVHRQGENKFTPEDINANLCTHIIYGYARPDRKEGVLQYDTKYDIQEKGWERFTSLKKRNPDLKVMLAVGGLFEGSSRFSRIAADPKERQIFVKSASALLRDYNFDGLEMSWVYPGFSEGSSSSDKENYPLLLRDLREEFGKSFIISVTVPGLERLIDLGYDISEILNYVDFINVWAGAYHPENAPTVNHPSPLYPLPNDPITKEGNVDTTISFLLSRGVPASIMNMLIANYGSYYILEDESSTDIGSPTEDEAENNEYRGGLIYNELCQKVRKENWTVVKVNATAMGPYAYKGTQWVAWDDEEMVRNKARYANRKNLGGIGFWTVDMDDFKGFCHLTDYPLLRGAREEFLPQRSTPTSTTGKEIKKQDVKISDSANNPKDNNQQ